MHLFPVECVEKFQKNITSTHFAMSKSQPLVFIVDHYAGRVKFFCVFIVVFFLTVCNGM